MSDSSADSPEAFWRELASINPSEIMALIKQERSSRSDRVRASFVVGSANDRTGLDQQLFDRLWLQDNVAEVNREFRDDLQADFDSFTASKSDHTIWPKYGAYHLTRNTRLISFYHCFGSRSELFPGRLEEETESLLLQTLWLRTLEKNDIAMARKSTWWVAGSENHDLNTKVTNILTSAIFAAEPAFRDRVYPNQGDGAAPGYHAGGYNPRAKGNPELDGKGRADWSDGKEYRPADHLTAWTAYLNEYLTERAKKGFFLENGAPGYMRFTISYLLLLYNFTIHEALRERTRMFLDLFWADWAMQSLGGLRGGPKTRHHHDAGLYDSMSEWARFYLGGPGTTIFTYAQQLIGDYEFAPWLWELVLNREKLGCFAYIARGIGEEEPTIPRPLGLERTMAGNTESRMVKYSWVTPDYVLGTQMDHPLAVHNHLSIAARWQGLITSDLNSRIATVSLTPHPGKTRDGADYNMEQKYHSVQAKNVLITQQSRRWTQINPDWFPAYPGTQDVKFGLYVGTGWARREERDGWLFLEQDNTYVAVRVLMVKTDSDPMAWAKGTDKYQGRVVLEEDTYDWNDDRTVMRLRHNYSPIIIEAGRRADFPDLASFQRQILGNRLEVYKTVNTQQTRIVVVYEGTNGDEIVFNAASPSDVPTVAGEHINYSHPKTFDSPYISSEYDSGVVDISVGDTSLCLDFIKPSITQEHA